MLNFSLTDGACRYLAKALRYRASDSTPSSNSLDLDVPWDALLDLQADLQIIRSRRIRHEVDKHGTRKRASLVHGVSWSRIVSAVRTEVDDLDVP